MVSRHLWCHGHFARQYETCSSFGCQKKLQLINTSTDVWLMKPADNTCANDEHKRTRRLAEVRRTQLRTGLGVSYTQWLMRVERTPQVNNSDGKQVETVTILTIHGGNWPFKKSMTKAWMRNQRLRNYSLLNGFEVQSDTILEISAVIFFVCIYMVCVWSQLRPWLPVSLYLELISWPQTRLS